MREQASCGRKKIQIRGVIRRGMESTMGGERRRTGEENREAAGLQSPRSQRVESGRGAAIRRSVGRSGAPIFGKRTAAIRRYYRSIVAPGATLHPSWERKRRGRGRATKREEVADGGNIGVKMCRQIFWKSDGGGGNSRDRRGGRTPHCSLSLSLSLSISPCCLSPERSRMIKESGEKWVLYAKRWVVGPICLDILVASILSGKLNRAVKKSKNKW
jgi:hypothetical protein